MHERINEFYLKKLQYFISLHTYVSNKLKTPLVQNHMPNAQLFTKFKLYDTK